MDVIRSIIGGLIGAAIAVAISSFLNVEASTGYPWFPLVTGFLTGLGALIIGGKSSGIASVISGVLAAAIALVAILMGTDAALLMSQSTGDFGPTLSKEQMQRSSVSAEESNANEAPDSLLDQEGADQEGADGEDEVASGQESEREPAVPAGLQSPDAPTAKKTPFNLPKFLYSSLGVLVAYQMGRGFRSKRTQEEVPAQ